ncbi:MAG: hypothetical protein IKX14_02105 [Neisseriaceae bacterium]|nr:hypothetical protein [Neisseriaceae bacterium]
MDITVASRAESTAWQPHLTNIASVGWAIYCPRGFNFSGNLNAFFLSFLPQNIKISQKSPFPRGQQVAHPTLLAICF